jgi:hypothetical protein
VPPFIEYDPAGQASHREAPAALVVPEGHARHPPPVTEEVPAGHARHVVEPAVDPVPAGHEVHRPPLSEYVFYFDQPSPLVKETRLTAGHLVHVVELPAELEPALHGIQPSRSAHRVPAGHKHIRPPRS